MRGTVSLREASRRTGISRPHLARAVARGELRALRLGTSRYYIALRDLDAWIASREVRPEAEGQ